MPVPAGTGLSRRRRSSRRARPRARGLRRLEARAAGVRGGNRARGDAAASSRSSSACSSRAAPTGFPCSRRRATRSTASSARASRSAAARAFAEDTRLIWHPALAGIASLYAEQKVTVFPAIGYTNAEPVALHLPPLLGGRRDEHRSADRLARSLPRRRRHRRQPAAGPVARRLARAGARNDANVPVALDPRPTTTSGAHACGGQVQDRMLECDRRSRRAAGRSGARGGRGGVARRSTGCARSSLPLQAKPNGTPGFTSPVTYPTSSDAFPSRLRRTRRDDRARHCRCASSR